MGVFKFIKWVRKKYPGCFQKISKNKNKNPSIVGTYHNLYLDLNGLIHTSNPQNASLDKISCQVEMGKLLCVEIERIFKFVKPTNLLMIAIDGVAPRAKMNQQRNRRFISVLEKEQIIKQGGFDSNCITPGTEFMDYIAQTLREYVASKMQIDENWKNLTVILSDSQVPGEGEHKIVEFIRNQRNQSEYNHNTNHIIYGLDADLFFLSLATHEINCTILRERNKDTNEITTIHVKNLPFTISEDEIGNIFSEYGRVKQVRIITDSKTKRSKGFGFVVFESPVVMEKVKGVQNKSVQGRTLFVSPSVTLISDETRHKKIDEFLSHVNSYSNQIAYDFLQDSEWDVLKALDKYRLKYSVKVTVSLQTSDPTDANVANLTASSTLIPQTNVISSSDPLKKDIEKNSETDTAQDEDEDGDSFYELIHLYHFRQYFKTEFEYIHLDSLQLFASNYIEDKPPEKYTFHFDLERLICDFTLLCFFVGNDFLPGTPKYELQKALHRLLSCYKNFLVECGPNIESAYLVENYQIQWSRVLKVIKQLKKEKNINLSLQEINATQHQKAIDSENTQESPQKTDQISPNNQDTKVNLSDDKSEPKISRHNVFVTINNPDNNKTEEAKVIDNKPKETNVIDKLEEAKVIDNKPKETVIDNKPEEVKIDNKPKETNVIDKPEEAKVIDNKPKETVIDNKPEEVKSIENKPEAKVADEAKTTEEVKSEIALNKSGSVDKELEFKRKYYKEKLDLDLDNKEEIRKITKDLMKTMAWNLEYYYRGCCSWTWFYPHHYSIFPEDFCDNLEEMLVDPSNPNSPLKEPIVLELGEPFKPLEQLVAVLPPQSATLLPNAFRHLVTSPQSPIIEFYPQTFEKTSTSGGPKWTSKAILNFIDEHRLKKALSEHEEKLTEIEKKRNTLNHNATIYLPLSVTITETKDKEIYELKSEITGTCTSLVKTPHYYVAQYKLPHLNKNELNPHTFPDAIPSTKIEDIHCLNKCVPFVRRYYVRKERMEERAKEKVKDTITFPIAEYLKTIEEHEQKLTEKDVEISALQVYVEKLEKQLKEKEADIEQYKQTIELLRNIGKTSST